MAGTKSAIRLPMRIWVTPWLVLTLVAANARCDIINWTNVAGGDWSATNNWSPHLIPRGLDTAVITNSGSYAISVNTNAIVGNLLLGASDGSGTQSLSINAGTFTLVGQATVNPGGQFNVSGGVLDGNPETGTATINGAVTFSSGALYGRLTIASNAVLNLTNSGASSSLLFTALSLTNYGMVVWNNVDLHNTFTPQIYNYGLWEAQTDNTFYGASSGTGPTVFNNYGTFRKSGGTHSVLDSNVTFNNYGTLDVRSGTLEMDGSGQDTGVVNTAIGTSLAIPSFSFALTGNPTFTGSGSIQGNLISSNALLHGTVTLNFSSTYYGALSGTLLTVASNTVLNLTSSNAGSALVLSALVLTNYGTVVWSNVDLQDTFSPQIDNYGLWDAQTDNTLYGERNGTGPTVFNNYGTFRKSGGIGTTSLDSYTSFNNAGTVDVQTATVEFDGPGIGTGVFNTTNGAVTAFESYILAGNPTFTGPGNIMGSLQGNEATLHGTLVAAGILLSGTLTVATNGAIEWLPGPALNVLASAPTTLTNYGVVTWSGGDLYAQANLVVDNYGLWDAQSDNVFQGDSSVPTVFNNYGTFRKSGGTGTTAFNNYTTFNNAGTVDVQTATVEFDGPGVGTGVFNTTNGAVTAFEISQSTSYTLAGNPTFTGTGTIMGSLYGNQATLHGTLVAAGILLSGTLTVATNGAIDWVQAPGLNVLASAPTSLTNYGVVTWSGGNLYAQANLVIDNYGLWDAQSDNVFQGNTTSPTVFNNYGTFRKSGGTSTTAFNNYTAFNNAGTVDVQTATVELDGPGVGTGVFNTTNGAVTAFEINQSTSYTLAGNPTFTGPGNIIGSLYGNDAMLHGTLVAAGILLSGTLTVATNGAIDWVQAPSLNVLASAPTSLTNYGVVTWSGGDLYSQAGCVVDNYGLWDAQSDNVFQGNGTGPTVFNNYGTFRKSGGTGTTLLDSYTSFNNAGTVDVQTATVELDGNNVLTGGTLNFRINSPTAFSSINLAGNAALTGTLSVNFNNGFSPVAGDAFALVTYGSETGTFASLNLPHLPSTLVWQENYGATALTLNVATAPLQLSQVTIQNGTNISFAWNAAYGQTYQLQSTTNLASTNWIDLGGTISGTNGTMTVSNRIGPDLQRFYRLVLLP